MIQTDVEDARQHLPELIEAAARGEEVLITADSLEGHPRVRLVAVARAPRTPEFGSARGLIHMTEDFDAPLADFDEYR
jgi:antitoxin (DNA-binding transcriptional repressor) of toxin-antitoxin stability system